MEPVAVAKLVDKMGYTLFRIVSEDGIIDLSEIAIANMYRANSLKVVNLGILRREGYIIKRYECGFIIGKSYPLIDYNRNTEKNKDNYTCIGYFDTIMETIYVLSDFSGKLVPATREDIKRLYDCNLVTNLIYCSNDAIKLYRGKLEIVPDNIINHCCSVDALMVKKEFNNKILEYKLNYASRFSGEPNFGRLDRTESSNRLNIGQYYRY